MLDELRRVTGGDDALKAKHFADLLYLRVNAGEQRKAQAEQHRQDRAQDPKHDVNEAIVSSLFWYVRALHNASGNGRYPEKIRQAQQACAATPSCCAMACTGRGLLLIAALLPQVIATAVSQAVALSVTHTSVTETGEKLSLRPGLISKCKRRYERHSRIGSGSRSLTIVEHCMRNDQMKEEFAAFAKNFWIDEGLTDEDGHALNFVRRSERTSSVRRNSRPQGWQAW